MFFKFISFLIVASLVCWLVLIWFSSVHLTLAFKLVTVDFSQRSKNIDCLMARTACLVCFISTVNGRSKKREKKPIMSCASSGRITKLKQSFLHLSISMGFLEQIHIFSRYLWWPQKVYSTETVQFSCIFAKKLLPELRLLMFEEKKY